MDFVDDEDLEAALDRAMRDGLHQVAHLVDLGVRGAVDFEDVESRALADLLAVGAGVARLGRRALLAVEGLGEQPRRGGLADAARPGEEEGVRHAARGDGGLQGTGHVILPDHVREALRP